MARRIAIVGAGSIGLYYGGKLAAAGHDVHFLMRSGFEEAAREGIRIYSVEGDIHLPHPHISRSPEEIGPSDLVVVSWKATANRHLEETLRPLLGPDTLLLTLQNGLGSDELLAELFGAERVLGGLCFICLTRRSPAAVDHIGKSRLAIGEYNRPPLPRTREIVQTFAESGVTTQLAEDLAGERWRKLVWNIPFNGLAVAAGGVAVDHILADPALHAECRALMDETIATAAALGHPLPAGLADDQIERTYPMGPYRPSTLVDWQAGHALEVEPIWGEPLRRAQAAGVATPHLAALYERLKTLNASRS